MTQSFAYTFLVLTTLNKREAPAQHSFHSKVDFTSNKLSVKSVANSVVSLIFNLSNMLTKIFITLAIFAVAQAGEDAPPPKAHTYNLNSVSKVAYPGPAVTKSVETYSAPSIEKTTTITRTITAPLNAPAERQISYSAPAPILKSAGYAAPAIVAPIGHAHVGYGAPVGYAAPLATGYGAPIGYRAFAGPAPYGIMAGGIGLATTYAAPALGYSLGGPAIGYGAPHPVSLAAPIAYGPPDVAAPIAKYGAPAPVDVKKGGY